MNATAHHPNHTAKPPTIEQNYLLRALPSEAKMRLSGYFELVTLTLGQSLYEIGDELKSVFFPTDSIISLLHILENGDCAEISVIGNDGMLGLALFMGGDTTPNRAVVQSQGYAFRLPAAHFREELQRHSELQILMLRYTQSLMTQMAQTAVCNRHHSVDQQLCRWLLLSLDRIPTNVLTMTQELIADMLGVRREGVSVAAGKLQKLGVIEYHRGVMTVLDRPKLEQLSCECYQVVKRECDRLQHYLPARRSP